MIPLLYNRNRRAFEPSLVRTQYADVKHNNIHNNNIIVLTIKSFSDPNNFTYDFLVLSLQGGDFSALCIILRTYTATQCSFNNIILLCVSCIFESEREVFVLHFSTTFICIVIFFSLFRLPVLRFLGLF